MAQAAKKAQPKAVPAKGVIVDELGRVHPCPARIARLAMEAWALKRQEQDLAARRREIEEELLRRVGVGRRIEIEGVCKATLVARETIRVCDAEALKRVLGPAWPQYLGEETRHKALEPLKALLSDGDHPAREALREAVEIKVSEAVQWRAA